MGWFCKDSSTMAYKVDGQWTNELECLFGCSDGKCKHPIEWDASSNTVQRKSLMPTRNDSIRPQGFQLLLGAVALAEFIFPRYVTQASGFVVGFGTLVLANVSGVFTLTNWPDYDGDWYNEPEFEKHYIKHFEEFTELYGYGEKLTSAQYKDICRNQINDNSLSTNRFRQTADGRLVSLNISTNLVVIGSPDGKIITCYIPKTEEQIKELYTTVLRGTWKPIFHFKILIV